MTDVLIITGGSKGIGKAIAEKYTLENYSVFSISRTITPKASYHQTIADLTNTTEVIASIETIFSRIDLTTINSITLINNAGSLGEINSLGNLDSEKIQDVIQLNTTTPLILSNQFISFTKSQSCKKQIITISSGAANNPYHGWSVYCSSKAAIEMMTKTIAAEQEKLTNGVQCIAIKPGVVDTNMQSYIRQTSKLDFQSVQRFIDLKENNQLYSPKFVADKIFSLSTNTTIANGCLIDIRDLQ